MNPTTVIKGLFATLTIAALITACDIAIKLTRPADPTFMQAVCAGIGEMYGSIEEVNCRLLDEPTVVYSVELLEFFRSYGFYIPGEDNIYIHPDAPVDRRTILEHEATHYVLYELDLVDPDDTCEQERVAREISTGDDDEWTARIATAYGCTIS